MPKYSPIIYVSKYFPVAEKISVASFIGGYFLKLLNVSAGNDIIILSLSFLSSIYFLLAYVPPNASIEIPETKSFRFFPSLSQNILPKLFGIGLSVGVMGLLFTIHQWNGFREMLLIGLSALSVASLIGLIFTINNDENRKALEPRLYRALLMIVIQSFLLWLYGLDDPTMMQ